MNGADWVPLDDTRETAWYVARKGFVLFAAQVNTEMTLLSNPPKYEARACRLPSGNTVEDLREIVCKMGVRDFDKVVEMIRSTGEERILIRECESGFEVRRLGSRHKV